MKTKLKNFFQGYGSILNLYSPVKSKSKASLSANDAEKIYEDWTAVGNDMRCAMTLISKDVSCYDKR